MPSCRIIKCFRSFKQRWLQAVPKRLLRKREDLAPRLINLLRLREEEERLWLQILPLLAAEARCLAAVCDTESRRRIRGKLEKWSFVAAHTADKLLELLKEQNRRIRYLASTPCGAILHRPLNNSV